MPIETVLNGLPHLVRMFSHTQFGLSFIMLTFDDNTTDTQARQQTLERLGTADLPQGVQPQLAAALHRHRRNLPLHAQGRRLLDARLAHPGGLGRRAQLPRRAGRRRRGHLWRRSSRPTRSTRSLRGCVTTASRLQQLYTALGRGNANVGGSKVTQGSQQYLIRGVGLLRSADEIKNIVITAHNGTPILVKDIADVTLGNLPVEGITGQDDAGRRRFRHRADAQRREPIPGAHGAQGPNRSCSTAPFSPKASK